MGRNTFEGLNGDAANAAATAAVATLENPSFARRSEREEVRTESSGLFRSEAVSALLFALERHSKGLYGHSTRVAESAFAMARALGLGAAMAEAYWLAGLLHDAGKLGISTLVLDKPAELSPREMDVIRRHPELGLDILVDFGFDCTRMILEAVVSHHERLDGSGYPYQMKGMTIPRVARVIAICDSFDAMTESRPYRKSKTLPEALADLSSHAGEWYEPELVELFCRLAEAGEIPIEMVETSAEAASIPV